MQGVHPGIISSSTGLALHDEPGLSCERGYCAVTKPMRISPEYNVDDWNSLTFSTEDEWQKAIDIFEDRIRGRFLDMIGAIEAHEYAGFAVMALDCLLIETLQQFREGEKRTPNGKSEEYFVQFLADTSFKDFFTPEMAKMFYKQIRCGILHQAETNENSRLLIRADVPLAATREDGTGLTINRRLFHQQLVRVFEEYVSRLRRASDDQLRSNFRTKMNCICRAVPTK